MESQQKTSLSKNQIWGRNNKKKPCPDCLVCRKPVKKHYRKLCSISCSNIWKYKDKKDHPNWKGGKVKVKCLNCKKEIWRHQFAIKAYKYIVCSRKCQGIYYRRFIPRKDTGIEILFENALKKREIYYQKQYNLWNICIADFYLDDYRIAVFVDGDYWHNLPNVVAKDRRQERELQGQDVRIVRVWGSQVEKLNKKNMLENFIDHLADKKTPESFFEPFNV